MDRNLAKNAGSLFSDIDALEKGIATLSSYISSSSPLIGGYLTFKIEAPSSDTGVTPALDEQLKIPKFNKQQSARLLNSVLSAAQQELTTLQSQLAAL